MKEESRTEKLAVYQATGKWPGMKSKVLEKTAWSDKVDKKGRRDERQRIKELKKPEEEEKSDIESDDDEDNLEEDYRLLKKMKKVRNAFLIRIMSSLVDKLFLQGFLGGVGGLHLRTNLVQRRELTQIELGIPF